MNSPLNSYQRTDESSEQVKPASSTESFATTHPLDHSPDSVSWQLAPTDAYQEELPRSFGRYKVLRSIGRGAFGCVYLGFDPVLKRDVAIKAPRFITPGGKSAAEQFLKEGQALARLNHENIVAVYDTGRTEDGQPFIVMEYVEGTPLSRLRSEPETRPERINYLVQVAQALQFAHKKHLIHRDLKPSNILVTSEGVAKVCDFGLAIDSEFQQAGEFAGTPAYMSPEQILRKSHLLDGRTDLWAWGVMLYEQLTGKRPFGGNTESELFDQILNKPVTPPTQLVESTDVDLEALCLKCLEKDVDKRPKSASEILAAMHVPVGTQPRSWALAGMFVSLLLASLLIGFIVFNSLTSRSDGEPTVVSRVEQTVVPDVAAVPPIKPIAWATTLASDFYDVSDKTGRIAVQSTATYSCFETHSISRENFRFGVSSDFQEDSGVAGIFVGLHKTAVNPVNYKCWLICVRRNNPGSGTWISVEECLIGKNELQHMAVRSRMRLASVKIGDDLSKSFTVEVQVEKQELIAIKYDDLALNAFDQPFELPKIPMRSSCGIVALSHVVFHEVKLLEY